MVVMVLAVGIKGEVVTTTVEFIEVDIERKVKDYFEIHIFRVTNIVTGEDFEDTGDIV